MASLIGRRSTTGIGKASGKPVLEFDSEHDAQNQANYDETKHGRRMYPYLCPTCHKWHLAPKASFTASSNFAAAPASFSTYRNTTTTTTKSFTRHRKSLTCFGKTSGTPLLEFETEGLAQEQAAFDANKYGKRMHPYHCATCGKWHVAPSTTTDSSGSFSSPSIIGQVSVTPYANDANIKYNSIFFIISFF